MSTPCPRVRGMLTRPCVCGFHQIAIAIFLEKVILTKMLRAEQE